MKEKDRDRMATVRERDGRIVIELDRPTSTEDLAAITQEVAHRGDCEFGFVSFDDTHVAFGRWSQWPWMNVVLEPLTGNAGLERETAYRAIVVCTPGYHFHKPVRSTKFDPGMCKAQHQAFAWTWVARYNLALVEGFPEFIEPQPAG